MYLLSLCLQVAYVPQSAFIYNATVRENILFGLPYNQQRYAEAIKASAVGPDIDNMPGQISCLLLTSCVERAEHTRAHARPSTLKKHSGIRQCQLKRFIFLSMASLLSIWFRV